MRLHKLIAQSGLASRRKAERLISSGQVKVNKKVITRQGVVVNPDKDEVEVNGKKISPGTKIKKHYFLLNKPKQYITTTKDEHNRNTVLELLPNIKGLFPVGRLDKDTTGALLITNDGELAHRLMHPKFEIIKTYSAKIIGKLNPEKLRRLRQGIYFDGKKSSPCEAKVVKLAKNSTHVYIKIHEGRKRQIKRMFEVLGHRVLELNRINYAGIKPDVPCGKYRKLKDTEIKTLEQKVGLV